MGKTGRREARLRAATSAGFILILLRRVKIASSSSSLTMKRVSRGSELFNWIASNCQRKDQSPIRLAGWTQTLRRPFFILPLRPNGKEASFQPASGGQLIAGRPGKRPILCWTNTWPGQKAISRHSLLRSPAPNEMPAPCTSQCRDIRR